MSRRAEIRSRTTAIGSVWVVSEDHLSLGDIRKFIAAAASLADDVPVSVTDLVADGQSYYFRRIDVHVRTTIADALVTVDGPATTDPEQPPQ